MDLVVGDETRSQRDLEEIIQIRLLGSQDHGAISTCELHPLIQTIQISLRSPLPLISQVDLPYFHHPLTQVPLPLLWATHSILEQILEWAAP